MTPKRRILHIYIIYKYYCKHCNKMIFITSWIIPEATPEVCLEHLTSAVDRLSETEKMHINKVGNLEIRAICNI